MNKFVLTSLVAALSGLFATPNTAKADGDEVAAAIGGFIGGVIVGSHIDRDHDDHRHSRVRGHIHIDSGPRHHRHGHWEWTSTRAWVPGRWIVSYDDCGRRVRYFERGHYERRRERIWVPHSRGYCRHHCR